MQSTEDSISKIQGIIADIRMINLHVSNFLTTAHNLKDIDKAKRSQDLRKLNFAHMHEYSKRVSDYLKKTFQELQRSKITIAPIIFRTLRNSYKDENFLRFENQVYGLKFVVTNLDKEAVMHLELYRRVRGGRVSTDALRRLEMTFTSELAHKYSDGVLSQELLQIEGRTILDEVTEIMSGEVCVICSWHLAFHPEHKIYLPPTLREVEEVRDLKNQKKKKLYYHESCL